MKIQAAIFDMDGLLIDSERIALQIFEQTCSHFKLSDTTELRNLFLSCIGMSATEGDKIIRSAFKDKIDTDEFLHQWELLYHGHVSQHAIPVKAGVEALLDALDNRGIPAAVATSTRTDRALDKLDKCNLLHRFKTITGGEQVVKSKPLPDIFLHAAQSINAAPEHCLAFEDSFNGVRAAVAAGMRVYQVPDLVEPDEELLSLGHTVVRSLGDVERLVWG